MLASMPSLLGPDSMRDFGSVRIPLPPSANPIVELPMYMVWHQRFQKDSAHTWLRDELKKSLADGNRRKQK
jgi:DNA-binding transcriptional LysR family regulator